MMAMTGKKAPMQANAAILLRRDANIWAITAGLVAGLGLFVATNWLVLRGGENVGEHLGLLGNYFVGYEVTFGGSIIGFAYAFATAFIATELFVRVYDYVSRKRQGTAPN
jgi:hypothetical protein